MNDQNETTQLRFLEETGIRLRQDGFTVEPIACRCPRRAGRFAGGDRHR